MSVSELLRAWIRKARDNAQEGIWRAKHQPLGQARALRAQPDGAHFHLGCGSQRIEGRINVDIRHTAATDVVADLNRPRLRSAGSVVSHAFLEHLYRSDREVHLLAVRQALTPDGWALYMGLPDFETIARLYLERAPGIVGDEFDLFNVYRNTHGDPEHADGWWLAQLHKSLFDRTELESLLCGAGFGSWVIANYAYPGEPHSLNLAFYARADGAATQQMALDEIRKFPAHVVCESLRWK